MDKISTLTMLTFPVAEEASHSVAPTDSSRRSMIFLRRRPLSCGVPSRRDSVGGGGSSRIFPWSQKTAAIQSGGGVVAELFRGLQKPARFSGGG